MYERRLSNANKLLIEPIDRDAEDAVRGRDGYDFYGYRLRVEASRGGGRDGGDRFGGGYGGGGGGRGREQTLPRYHPDVNRSKGTGYRVLVKGLPRSASWQDLKVSSAPGRRGVGNCHHQGYVKPLKCNGYNHYVPAQCIFERRHDFRLLFC